MKLKTIDNGRIKELLTLRHTIRKYEKTIDLESAQGKLKEYTVFAEKPPLTGMGGYKRKFEKETEKDKSITKLGINASFYKDYQLHAGFYSDNLKAIEEIKTAFNKEEHAPGKFFGFVRKLTYLGAFAFATRYFWTHTSELHRIMGFLKVVDQSTVLKVVGAIASGVIFGVIIKGIYKKIDRIRGLRNVIKYDGREQNPLFNTVTYLTARKRRKALRIIKRIGKKLEKIKKKQEKQAKKTEEKPDTEKKPKIKEKPETEKTKKKKRNGLFKRMRNWIDIFILNIAIHKETREKTRVKKAAKIALIGEKEEPKEEKPKISFLKRIGNWFDKISAKIEKGINIKDKDIN